MDYLHLFYLNLCLIILQETYQRLPLESKVLYLFNAVQNQAGDVDEKHVAAVMLRRLMANDFVQFFANVSIWFNYFNLFLYFSVMNVYFLAVS